MDAGAAPVEVATWPPRRKQKKEDRFRLFRDEDGLRRTVLAVRSRPMPNETTDAWSVGRTGLKGWSVELAEVEVYKYLGFSRADLRYRSKDRLMGVVN